MSLTAQRWRSVADALAVALVEGTEDDRRQALLVYDLAVEEDDE